MVPLVGIELTTYRLQGGCSTTELKRRQAVFYCVAGAIFEHRYLIRVSEGRFADFPAPEAAGGGSGGLS
jgi:hypothetical protein